MNRVAVVTGGTRGIGEAISLKLQEKGRHVIANYGGNDAAAKAFSERTGIAVQKWDVGDHKSCIDACAAIEAQYGQIDIMVNNAGITRDATMMKMTFEQWDEVIRVDLTGCFNMAKAVFAGMRERKWGRIVNIGSVNGQGGPNRPSELCRRQIRHSRVHKITCGRRRALRRNRKRHRARIYWHRNAFDDP